MKELCALFSFRVSFTCLLIGGRYQTLQTMAQLLIILSRYLTMPNLLLSQKASPNCGSY